MKKFLRNYLTENEQKILLFILFFAFLGLIFKYTGLIAGNDSTAPDSLNFEKDYEIKYDLNNVTKEELITIPGIGEKKAEDILEFRNIQGFRSKRDLMNIKGIGEKSFVKIEKYFYRLANEEELEISESVSETIDHVNPVKININKASVEEFTELKGIGPTKAEKIIALRNELGRFTSIEDLLQVKGIGSKTLEKFKDQIIIGE
ncbi:MAG: helix-hairpin-helix domain-containing protein [Candidatus Cloacimonetes bacterium]|nr:helix-hairpin-helix domain-containing protein [Candidatus Cloacimonadota bacterium]MBL7149911.1 helix-hairpin-helix domain-containing protein [Candidatus Cloacimonadota bacterium]